MATYLITGGCGFIGSHLADALVARGDRVRLLDDLSTGRTENAPREAEIIVGDVTDAALVQEAMADVDGCFHLAAVASVARSNEAWVATHRTNQTGAVHVFDAAKKAARSAPIPVVYASSAAVYGDSGSMPLTEDAPTRPITAYGADKLGCELHARAAARTHGVPTVGLRLFNVYGPRQDPSSPYSGVISIFADRLRRGAPIDVFGDGLQEQDFVYVADAVAFFLAAMAHADLTADALNVCRGQATSVLDLAATLGRLCRRAPEIRFAGPRPGDIRRSLGAPEKAARTLGVNATTTLEEGLTRTLAWLAPPPPALEAAADRGGATPPRGAQALRERPEQAVDA